MMEGDAATPLSLLPPVPSSRCISTNRQRGLLCCAVMPRDVTAAPPECCITSARTRGPRGTIVAAAAARRPHGRVTALLVHLLPIYFYSPQNHHRSRKQAKQASVRKNTEASPPKRKIALIAPPINIFMHSTVASQQHTLLNEADGD